MTIVTNATILEQACLLLGAATDEVCLTSPWISEGKLRGLLEAITQVGVRVRVVFRISKSGDLNITRANALKILRERPDTDIRYSQAVHAKTILVDGKNGIISSSNITRAGMSKDGNQEMGVTVNGVQAQDAQNVFEAIWASSTRLPAECVGFLLNPTSAHRLTFVALDPGLSMGTLVRWNWVRDGFSDGLPRNVDGTVASSLIRTAKRYNHSCDQGKCCCGRGMNSYRFGVTSLIRSSVLGCFSRVQSRYTLESWEFLRQ